MTDKLVQHKHCPICSKAMSVGKETCSDECADEWERKQKSRRNTLLWFYGGMLILIILLGLQFTGAF